MSQGNNVRVVCRFRPPNQNEKDHGHKDIVEVDAEQKTVKLIHSEGNHTFSFDRIFPPGSPQKNVYEDAAKPVVEDIMKGYNGTIFVYGQTGSGKTFTMQGPSIDDQEMKGIIPRMINTIFEGVMKADENIEFLVKASYLEIYMEKIRDLLDSTKQNLKVREEKSKGIWVEGATEVYVSTEQDVLDVIRTGSANRAIAETKMNSESSRSHSIFILSVNQKNLNDMSNKTGKLYLVDLAGSEKVEKTGAQGTTLDEAKTINKSLSALGNVINALTDGKSQHIPYRDSKLTRVLQESLGGNSRTTLVINCSPSSYNEAETLSTLRFGNRAKSIQNRAKVNQERSVAELKILLTKAEKDIARLNATIAALTDEIRLLRGGADPMTKIDSLDNITLPSGEHASLPNVVRIQDANKELEEQVKQLEDEKKKLEELFEEFKEKAQDINELTVLRQELVDLKINEENLAKENELLIIKMADITIENEKLQYENSELCVQVEKLETEQKILQEEHDNLQKNLEMVNERHKSSKISSLLSLKKEQEKEEVQKPQGLSLLEEIEIAVQHDQNEPEDNSKSSSPSNYEAQQGGIDVDDLEHATIEALRAEVKKQKVRISQLERENEIQKKTIEQIQKEHAQIAEKASHLESSNSADQPQRDIEFNSLKAALFKDLENRCQKVVELEMLLDEARDQYQSLLVQVKNSNTSALQRKCIFLQKNLEQLTKVQQELVNENNRLKIDNQVNVKQIAVRNERIHGLELLLQDTQAQLQRNVTGGASGIHRTLSAQGGRGTQTLAQGRIAKPLRGGGGKPVATATSGNISLSSPSPGSPGSASGRPRSASIWDIFKAKPREETQLPQTPQPVPVKTPSPKPPTRT